MSFIMTKGKFSEIFRDESNVKSSGYEKVLGIKIDSELHF